MATVLKKPHRTASPSSPRWAAAVAAAKAALARNDLEEAGRQLEGAAAMTPRNADIQANLGAVRARQQRLDDAVRALEAALAAEPGHGVALRNLLITLTARGNDRLSAGALQAGIADLRRALELDPSAAEVESALGLGLSELGRPEDAIVHYLGALERRPGHPPTLNRLGMARTQLGRLEEARLVLEEAASAGLLEAMVNVSGVCFQLGRVSEAEAWARRAVELQPRAPEARNNLGLAMREQGEVTEALAQFETACTLAPGGFLWQSGRLLTLNYLPGISGDDLAAAHRQVGEAWVAAVGGRGHLDLTDPDPDRRLRIGYVSPDFRTHSVGFFVESFLGHHDPTAVEVTCYSNAPRCDQVTERLRAMAHRWHDVAGMSDLGCERLIAADGIDVLVDLAGHTSRNRLAVFARRAAPVQMTYLGYGVRTGLPTMDHLLTDELADPAPLPGKDGPAPESLLHLPGGYLCYRPPFGPEGGPPVGPLPARRNGHVTFGSFNNLAKISDVTLEVWAAILSGVPGSTLLLKARGLEGSAARARLADRLVRGGLPAARFELAPPAAGTAQHLECYGRVDVALDTFPYNGTTTTCEALWMGVPVVTLAGQTHMSRVGHSILARLGGEDLVARAPDEYVRRAGALASDLDRLETLRRDLRPRMLASPLMDGPRLARALEASYRRAWRQRLARPRD